MRYLYHIPFITLLLTCAVLLFLKKQATGTTYPIPEDLIQKHFYNDKLAESLSTRLSELQTKFRELEERVKIFKGISKLKPFTYAKYTLHYTPQQVENFLKSGWIQTKEFGWHLARKRIQEILPSWIRKYEEEVTMLENNYTPESIPENRIKSLNETRQKIADFMATRKTYLTRLIKWDEWCRKGPWLIEDKNPDLLAQEIESLKKYMMNGKSAIFPQWLSKELKSTDTSSELLLKLAEVNLKKKQTVWDWYYGFRKKPKGKLLYLTSDGYRFLLKYQIYGPGARIEALKKIKTAIERYWKGSVEGIPFKTEVHISIRNEEEAEDPGAVQVRIGAENETVWPSSISLPYHFDETTVAHEFGHGFGFPDRYRDIYDFSERVYRTYQWNIFTLMSAQNISEPLVTEEDLKLIIDNYLNDRTVHQRTEDIMNQSFPTQ